MNAPDRRAEVAKVVAGHPPAVESPTDEARRALLFDIVRVLVALDGASWGVLVKTDQNNKIPADIIVWRETMEHFDVLTGSDPPGSPVRASWGPAGVVQNPRWIWQAVPGVTPPQPPEPPDDDDDVTGDLLELLAEVKALRADLAAVKASLPIVFPEYRASNRWLGSITLTPVPK